MAKTAMTHARLTPEIKEQAEAILKELGISISTAYEMFYRQIIAQQGIPFDLHIPNKDTLQAMKDARNGKGKKYVPRSKNLMLPIRPTSKFKKDLKRAAKQNRNIKMLQQVLKRLAIPAPLSKKHKDHKLKGEWVDFRECHVEPDWLMIYTI